VLMADEGLPGGLVERKRRNTTPPECHAAAFVRWVVVVVALVKERSRGFRFGNGSRQAQDGA